MSKQNGLFKLELGGKKLELKGDHKCYASIEESLGKSLTGFYIKELSVMDVKASDMAMIYVAGLESIGDKREGNDYDSVYASIIKDGAMVHMRHCISFVANMVTGWNVEGKKSTGK